jgi:hypothetical protein
MTKGGAGGAEGTTSGVVVVVALARSDLRRGRTEVAVSSGACAFAVCCWRCDVAEAAAGTGGAEMSVDWMTRSRKGEQK